MTRTAKAQLRTRRLTSTPTGRNTSESEAAIRNARPISSPSPSFSGCRQLFGRVGIAREIFIVKGTFNPAMSHAVCIGGDTEGDVYGGGSITVFAGSPEVFEGHI
jgi:hypothetical protein